MSSKSSQSNQNPSRTLSLSSRKDSFLSKEVTQRVIEGTHDNKTKLPIVKNLSLSQSEDSSSLTSSTYTTNSKSSSKSSILPVLNQRPKFKKVKKYFKRFEHFTGKQLFHGYFNHFIELEFNKKEKAKEDTKEFFKRVQPVIENQNKRLEKLSQVMQILQEKRRKKIAEKVNKVQYLLWKNSIQNQVIQRKSSLPYDFVKYMNPESLMAFDHMLREEKEKQKSSYFGKKNKDNFPDEFDKFVKLKNHFLKNDEKESMMLKGIEKKYSKQSKKKKSKSRKSQHS